MRRRTLELSKLASRTMSPSPRNSSKFVPNCCLPHGTSLIISVVQLAASKNFSMMCRKLLASAVLSNAVISAERESKTSLRLSYPSLRCLFGPFHHSVVWSERWVYGSPLLLILQGPEFHWSDLSKVDHSLGPKDMQVL